MDETVAVAGVNARFSTISANVTPMDSTSAFDK
jgi:hypothetical protein